jgi:protein disulfide-isomerase A1
MEFRQLLFLTHAALATVVELNQRNFGQFLNDNPVTLIEFYAPWCSYCKSMAPEYESASQELEGIVKLAKVNCDDEAELCTDYAVFSYPTLKVFHDKHPFEYTGERWHSSIVDVMRRQVAPTVTMVKDLQQFKDGNSVVIVLESKINSKEYKVFHDVAEKLHEQYMFGMVEGDSNKITLYKRFDELLDPYSGDMIEADIIKFIKMNGDPLMPDIGVNNYQSLLSRQKPMAYFMFDKDEHKKDFGPMVEKLAFRYRHIQFAYIDARQFPGFAVNLGVEAKWPAFSILSNNQLNEKYPMDQSKAITENSLAKFIADYEGGKLEPHIMSEPIPERNSGPVLKVVGKSFKSIVYDTSKDVFIVFYSRLFKLT